MNSTLIKMKMYLKNIHKNGGDDDENDGGDTETDWGLVICY